MFVWWHHLKKIDFSFLLSVSTVGATIRFKAAHSNTTKKKGITALTNELLKNTVII